MKIYVLHHSDWEDQRIIYADTDDSKVYQMEKEIKEKDEFNTRPVSVTVIDTDNYESILKNELSCI